MMALACIITHRFLKGEVLLPAKEKKVADWCIGVRTMKNCALSDAQAAFQSDWIGGGSFRFKQHRKEVIFASANLNVQKIARAAPAGFIFSPSICQHWVAGQMYFSPYRR